MDEKRKALFRQYCDGMTDSGAVMVITELLTAIESAETRRSKLDIWQACDVKYDEVEAIRQDVIDGEITEPAVFRLLEFTDTTHDAYWEMDSQVCDYQAAGVIPPKKILWEAFQAGAAAVGDIMFDKVADLDTAFENWKSNDT